MDRGLDCHLGIADCMKNLGSKLHNYTLAHVIKFLIQ